MTADIRTGSDVLDVTLPMARPAARLVLSAVWHRQKLSGDLGLEFAIDAVVHPDPAWRVSAAASAVSCDRICDELAGLTVLLLAAIGDGPNRTD